MQRMPRVRQRDQGVDVQEIPHGKSAMAARTSSLVTLVPAGACVIRKPVFESVTNLGRSRLTRSGVRTIEPPSTLQENFVPGCRRSRIRACFGSTTWPLLDNVAVMTYCLTVSKVSQIARWEALAPPAMRSPNWLHSNFCRLSG